jgi:hypothetical protein
MKMEMAQMQLKRIQTMLRDAARMLDTASEAPAALWRLVDTVGELASDLPSDTCGQPDAPTGLGYYIGRVK